MQLLKQRFFSYYWKSSFFFNLETSPAPMTQDFKSMSLVIFCLLFSSVDYVPLKGEIIWYLSLTLWLISLSIMLSSSIHAVAKDRGPSFSLLCRISLCKCTTVFWSKALRLLLVLGYCKLCCYEHWGAQVLLDWCFRGLGV